MPYTRPEDWLDMTTPESSEEKVVILSAVFNSAYNYVAVTCEGDYHVDWGDGNEEDVASGVAAEHDYAWGDLDSSTLTSVGYRQTIITITPQGGESLTVVDLNTRHSSLNQTDSSFADSHTVPFLDIRYSLPNATTITSLGGNDGSVRCRMVEVLRAVNHGSVTDLAFHCYVMPQLSDVEIDLQNVTTASNMFNGCRLLRNLTVTNSGSISNYASMLNSCYSLESLQGFDFSSATDMLAMCANCYRLSSAQNIDAPNLLGMAYLFQNCRSLVVGPQIDAPLCTNWEGVYNACVSLISIPDIDMPLATNMQNFVRECHKLSVAPVLTNTDNVEDIDYLFYQCYSLQELRDDYDFSAVTSATRAFAYCYGLTSIPAYAFDAIETMNDMFLFSYRIEEINATFSPGGTIDNAFQTFSSCSALKSLPELDLSGAGSTDNMCYGCTLLEQVGNLDISSAINTDDMFTNCNSLTIVGDIDASSSNDVNEFFKNCESLVKVGTLDFSGAEDCSGIFDGCEALRILGGLDIASATNLSSAFRSAGSLQDVGSFVGPDLDVDLSECQLTSASLDIIYTGLPSATRTITVTGNPGISGDDPSIATAKGWTVTDT